MHRSWHFERGFGKLEKHCLQRSSIKDTLDVYANIETSFLLQGMESYNGITILSTNMEKTLDNAFVRRFRFIINFPFPDKQSRFEMWEMTFPKATPWVLWTLVL
jgi:SpoVK/Ycf46/Vps4 family AAA+-type ATPase